MTKQISAFEREANEINQIFALKIFIQNVYIWLMKKNPKNWVGQNLIRLRIEAAVTWDEI